MFSFKSIVLIAAAFTVGAESSAVPAVAAPLVAPAQIGYAHAVPQNIPPYAAQINVQTRALNPVFAAPYAAAPYAAAPLAAAPLAAAPLAAAAPYAAAPLAAAPLAAAPLAAAPLAAAPFAAASPYIAPGPVPYAAAPFSFPTSGYAAPFPYAAAPLIRYPFGNAPAFVR